MLDYSVESIDGFEKACCRCSAEEILEGVGQQAEPENEAPELYFH